MILHLVAADTELLGTPRFHRPVRPERVGLAPSPTKFCHPNAELGYFSLGGGAEMMASKHSAFLPAHSACHLVAKEFGTVNKLGAETGE